MTRKQLANEERKAQAEFRKAERKLGAARQKLEAEQAAAARIARRARTGLQVDEAGWFAWDEATVLAMLTLVGERLKNVDEPLVILQELLTDISALATLRL
jgi:hypothetical protein